VSRTQRLEGAVRNFSFSRDNLAKGKATFTDILKRSAIAEGGHWAWQAEKLLVRASRGGAVQWGRGSGQFRGRHPAPQWLLGPPPRPPVRHQAPTGGGAGGNQAAAPTTPWPKV
jgi:hypothetical protein